MKTFGNAAVMSSALLLMALSVSGGAEAGCTPAVGSDGDYNTCIGTGALFSNSTGDGNTAIGYSALYSNTEGAGNTASGSYALYKNSKGTGNTAIGNAALLYNTTGSANTASGYTALSSNTTGAGNTASGVYALLFNTKGNYNTASGALALYSNTTGSMNLALGFEAAKAQTTGSSNTAVGYRAGLAWTTGKNNIAIGAGAGKNQTTGSNNIAIGAVGAVTDTAVIRIGTKGTQTSAFMAGIRGVNVTGGQAVLVNAAGQLGVASSSARYKQDIHPMGDASNRLLELRPVTFRYKQAEEDGSRPLQYGLIAEDVAEVMPELAVYNEDGTPESVAYQVLPSLLLNEYQKQAKELADTKAELAENKAQVEAMEADMASLKLIIGKLAAAQSVKVQLATAP